MNKPSKTPTAWGRRLAWALGISCVACCAAPLFTVAALGLGAAAAGIGGADVLAAGLALAGGLTWALWRWRRRAPQCGIDGACRATEAPTER